MKYVLTLLLLAVSIPSQADDLDNYVTWFHRNSRPSILKNTRRLIPFIRKAGERYSIDPYLIGVVISFESSFLPRVVGAKGERGLTQCHGVAARGFNLNTIQGQVDCGAARLRMCLTKCGDLTQALTCYQTNARCNPIIKSAKRRAKRYREGRK